MPTLKIFADTNLKQAQVQFEALTAQVEALNKAMAKTALTPAGGTVQGYKQVTAGLAAASHAYNNALAASGAFRVETLKVNDVIATQTDLLRRQKLGFKDVWGSAAARKRMQAIRREQVALSRMSIRAVEGGVGDGTMRATLAIPNDIPKQWETAASKMKMLGYEVSSVSRTMLNWGKNTQWAGRQLMAGLTYPVAAFGAAAGVMYYQVNKQLTRVQKVYNTTADQFSASVEEQKAAQAELNKVREDGMKTATAAAKEYGASVTDTLSVQADLAATGQKGVALQKATTEVMKNAMLGEIDYQTTTKATIALQQTLNMNSQQLAETWAYMNSVENQTSLTMADFAQAIPIALGPLKQMGGTVQDLGTLLTAMVSRGVQVGKAANAIKATAQRLIRPSQQVQKEFKALTGADITAIQAKNQGNLIGMLKDIYSVTKDLSNLDRTKVFAGLFGSYQLATMSAMVDGMGDLENGIGQVTTAYDVGQQSAESWFQVQKQEIGAFQKSAAGQFKRAFETLKAELADVGEPFLQVATSIVGALTKILEAFDKLPDGVKKFSAIALIGVAAVGPLIMLAGLVVNLIANFGLMAGWALRLAKGFNILNKAEWAETKLAQLHEKGLMSQTSAMEQQTMQLKALTDAQNAHNAAVAKFLGMPAPASMFTAPGVMNTNANQAATQAYMAQFYNPKAKRYQAPSGPGVAGGFIPQMAMDQKTLQYRKGISAEMLAQQKLGEEIMASQSLTARNASAEVKSRAAALRIEGAMAEKMTVTKLMSGAAAVSMGAMMVTSNKTVDSISKWSLALSFALPAVMGIGKGMSYIAKSAWAATAASRAQAAANLANAAATAKAAGAAGSLMAGLRGAGSAAVALLGPVGLAVAAIGTAGFLLYKLHKRDQEITKEKKEQANAMYEQNRLLEDQLGIQQKNQSRLSSNKGYYQAQGLPDPAALAEDMKKSSEYTALIADLKSKDVMQTEKDAIAMTKYRDILASTGGTAQKAQLYLEAMFQAAGDGALEAQRKAYEYSQQLGSTFTSNDQFNLFRNEIDSIYNDRDKASIQEQGENIGKDLANSIVKGGKDNANQTFGQFSSIINDQFKGVFNSLDADMQEMFKNLGISGDEALQQFTSAFNASSDKGGFLADMGIGPQMLPAIEAALGETTKWGKASEVTAGIIKEIGGQLGIEEETLKRITTLKQLQNTWEWKLATATKETAKNTAAGQIAMLQQLPTLHSIFGGMNDVSDEQKLQIANQVRAAAGLDALKNIWQVNAWLAGKIKDDTGDTAVNIDKIASSSGRMHNLLSSFQFNNDNFKTMLQQGMEGVQSDLVAMAQNTLQDRADAATNALQNSLDAQADALDKKLQAQEDAMQRRHENQMDAFDKRWDRRKKKVEDAYQAQEDGIDKAIEKEQKEEDLRQKMFDAEMTRIERLKDAANSAIDFTMAVQTGQLDEAAKIQNDMIATAQSNALSDAAAASGAGSQSRQDRLSHQKDLLERQKDARLDAMQEEEDKQRKHLERMQQAEEKALKAKADAEKKAQQNAADAQMAALKASLDAQKDQLDSQLDLFSSFTARNKKELDDWLKKVGLSYDDFGLSIKGKGNNWAGFIQQSLQKHVRAAGLEIANDQIWAALGGKAAKQTLRGMGFGGFAAFKRFIMTGELPKDFGKNKGTAHTQTSINPAANHPVAPPGETLHSGGMVGMGINNRRGVPRTTKGMGGNEVMVRALTGEMMMNRQAVKNHGPMLSAMNRGMHVGGDVGPAGAITAMVARGIASGVSKSFKNAYAKKTASSIASAFSGVFAGSSVGVNANAFTAGPGGFQRASIPGRGWVNSHDYENPLGSPLYAFNDAVVIESRAITSGGSPGNGLYSTPYRSYGETIVLQDAAGNRVRYAHLNPNGRYVKVGDRVPGGSLIGRSGQTGNASGPHTHFEVNGAEIAREWFASHSIGLSKGGYTKKDTPATVHKNEMVIDAKRTKQLYGLIDSVGGSPFWPWLSSGFNIGPNGMPVFGAPKSGVTKGGKGSPTGKTEQVRTGTFNVKFNTPNGQTMADLSKLMGMTDILALSEWSEQKRALNSWVQKHGWGILDPGPARNDSAVMWNKAKYNLAGQSVRQMNTLMGVGVSGGRGVGGAGAMYATGALLKSKAGKFSLWQIAAHTIAHLWKSAINRQVQQQQFGTLGRMAKDLGKNGTLPVFVGGDLNNDPRNMGGGHGAQGAKWFAPLLAAGLKDNWNKGTMKGNFTMGDRYIDHVFSNSLAKAIDQRVVGGLHSDHKALLTNFEVPQLSKGAMNIRWDNTLANLHAGEGVLTKDLNAKFKQGVDNFADGPSVQYNAVVNLYGADVDADDVADAVERRMRRHEARLPRSKR